MINKIYIETESRNVYPEREMLGISGENKFETLQFNLDSFIDGQALLRVERKETTGTAQYEIAVEKGEDCYTLEVLSSLLAYKGTVKLQLVIMQENLEVFKSKTFNMKVLEEIEGAQEIPEQYPTWQELASQKIIEINNKIDEVTDLEQDLEDKVESGYFKGDKGDTGEPGQNGIDGQDGYTPVKGVDYFTQEDIDEIENGVKTDLEETVLVDYSLITETGSKIYLSINTTNYKLTAILKDKNNATICTSNEIDLPLETMVVGGSYDNTTKKIILTKQNGTTVEFSVADLVSGLVSESQLQTILANYYTQTEINNLLANKVDKVAGKGLSTNDFTDEYKEQIDTNTEDIEDIQEEQTEQNTEIEKLQTENERLRNTLPTTTGVGQDITLYKTAELEFKKPPLPMGNSEQESTTGKNLLDKQYFETGSINETTGEDIANSYNGRGNNYIPVLPNTTYTLSVNTIITTLRLSEYTNDKTHIQRNLKNRNTKLTITTTANTYFLRWSLNYNNSTTLTQEIINSINLQLEEGSTATSYEPYTNGASPNPDYPQEITNVTGDVEVVVENKNLCNGINQGYYLTMNTSMCGKLTGNNGLVIRVDGTSNYTVSTKATQTRFRVACLNSLPLLDGNVTTYNGANRDGTSNSITINTNGYKYLIVNATDLSSIQIEKGTATSYVPHKEQVFTFPLGNEKLMLGDYLADDGIHHVRRQATESGTAITLNDAKSNGAYLCNKKTAGNLVEKTLTFDEAITDALIEYELEEEVIVPYTTAQQTAYNQIKQAISYEEQTNISSNQNAIFNVEAYLDTKVILSEKVDKIEGKGLSTNDFTNTYKNSVDSNTDARHTHTNKQVLDNITSNDVNNWNNKSDFSGSYNDLSNKPTIPSEVTENTVSNWGFTKNTGTITGITMNGVSKGTSGVVDLGTVITQHQDISGKFDTTKVKNANSTTAGDVYDVRYINSMIGNIETLLQEV